jgi:hypothetical protein
MDQWWSNQLEQDKKPEHVKQWGTAVQIAHCRHNNCQKTGGQGIAQNSAKQLVHDSFLSRLIVLVPGSFIEVVDELT